HTCPGCQKALVLPDSVAGKTIKCPGCGSRVAVPPPTAIQTGTPSRPKPPPVPPPLPTESLPAMPRRRSRGRAVLACTAVLVLAGAGGGAWWFFTRPSAQPGLPVGPLSGSAVYNQLLPSTVLIDAGNTLGSGVLVHREPF